MVCVALFEGPLHLSDVLFDCFAVGVCHLCLVHDVSRLALSIKRASVFFCAAVTRWVDARKPAEFSVMVADDAGDVGNTTIAHLELVFAEDLAQFRLSWEVFSDQLEKTAADVGCDTFTKRRIEPSYIAFALTIRRQANLYGA